MAFEIIKAGGPTVEATERLYRTEDDRLVPEGHPDARWLFCAPGQPVSKAALEAYEEGAALADDAELAEDEPETESGGGAEGVNIPETTTSNTANVEAAESAGGLADRTVDELRDELRARDLPVSGTKDELIARLEDAEGDEEVEG